LERVEITGSSIKRVQTEGALPVQVITREELERSGITTAEQLILELSVNGNGLDNLASNADVVGGAQRGNNGATHANLRGQGSNATLILLNGRRVAAHGLNGGVVDLNQIPMAAVQRVEILKDGASAIYGTDAIGGVINFILRTDYSGAQVSGTADITEAGGGNIFHGSLLGGFGNLSKDGFNFMATLSVRDAKALRGDQRDFVNTFQPNRGLSVDTRGTPFATLFPLAGTLFPNAAAFPNIPGTNTPAAAGSMSCVCRDNRAAMPSPAWTTTTPCFGTTQPAALACAWDTGKAAVLQQPIKRSASLPAGPSDSAITRLRLNSSLRIPTRPKRFSNCNSFLIPPHNSCVIRATASRRRAMTTSSTP
jgi:Outer membrane cobalamin receptor protein